MDALFLIGRILFALLFVASGLMGHFVGYAGLRAYAESRGIPAAGPLVILSGIVIVLGGLGVAIGAWRTLPRWVWPSSYSSPASSCTPSGGRRSRWAG